MHCNCSSVHTKNCTIERSNTRTKKIVSLLLILTMLVTLSPAVAADDSSATPTVEEILNSYHVKAFEAKIAEERDGASTYSRRSGTEKTPEEEAVDELTAAGYEAYNVTPENYYSLEEALHTDFSTLGLDPRGRTAKWPQWMLL